MDTKRTNLKELNKLLLSILLLGSVLFLGKPFLIPVAVAGLLAMLLFPFAQRLENSGLKRPFAAFVSVIGLLVILAFLAILVRLQMIAFKEDFPSLEMQIQQKTESIQWLISKETGISENKQEDLLDEQKVSIITSVTKFLKNFVLRGLYILLMFFVVLAYSFLLIIYRKRIKIFLIKLNFFNTQAEAQSILSEISMIVHQYLKGIFTVISVLAVIYTLGFWLLGIRHALLFAIITALLRIIPYVGSFTGIAFPIAFAFLTKASIWYPAGVLLFFVGTQLLEAYFLTPAITGKKVKLNPLSTIMAILLGHLIWGVLGMVLFVPLFGVLKVTFDRIPQLSPFGFLLGKDDDE
jgi:predicted PurR-regulated permease PerM